MTLVRVHAATIRRPRQPDGDPPLDHRDHRRAWLQAHIELGADVDDFSRSGDAREKRDWASWATSNSAWPDMSVTSRSLFAVADADRTVGIRVQDGIIRQAPTSAVHRAGSRNAVPRRRWHRRVARGPGSTSRAKPRLNTTQAAIATAAGEPAPRESYSGRLDRAARAVERRGIRRTLRERGSPPGSTQDRCGLP